MQALRFNGVSIELAGTAKPEANGEAIVRVVRSGICGTDLEIAKGYSNFRGTIGHEFVGVVEAASERRDLVGKRVVGEINAGCGICELCESRDSRHCPTRTVLGIVNRDGAHAEFLKLPSRNLYEVPENVSDEAAVFVEPLAAAVGISELADLSQAENIAVIGDGKLGILCARATKISAPRARVTLIGKHREKLDLAAKSGVETMMIDEASKLSRYFDVIIEASGSERGFASAVDLVKPRGTIVLKSTFHGTPTWEASRVVVNEITVTGSRCGRFEPALGLLSSNQIQVADLISEEFCLQDGIRAFEKAGTKGTLKVLLKMDRN